MAKRRKKTFPASVASHPPAATVSARESHLELDVLVAIAAVLCIVVTYLSRQVLNPDGVSYLDLATAMRQGDWSHFVQGYWSPLFPFLTGAIGSILGLTGPQLVVVTHMVNLGAALGALFIIWRWARQPGGSRLFGRAAVVLFLIVSWGLPRIEAVTPDVLLFTIVVWLGYELLAREGRRWALIGALLGAAFLAKTSAWPWLLVAVALRLWAANDAASRRRAMWSAVVCTAVMLTWIVPMSLKAGHVTVGSSGRLNYSWYILANTSRLPDTDTGNNAAYQQVIVGNGQQVTLATFDDAAHWTYQPWGDPTAWRENVLAETGGPPTALELAGYWLRDARLVFGLWLLPTLLFVLAPVMVLQYRPGMWRELITTRRDVLVVMALGVVGLLQFVAIHAEPRLIAPFGMLLALAWITWCDGAAGEPRPGRSAIVQRALGWAGVACALVFAVSKVIGAVSTDTRLNETVAQVTDLQSRLRAAGQSISEIAIVGPAAPVLSAAYWIGAHIVMQVPPRSVAVLAALPPAQVHDLMMTLFSGKVSVVWQTSADGGMKMLIVPPQR